MKRKNFKLAVAVSAIFVLSLTLISTTTSKFTSIEKLVKAKKLYAKVESIGGHSGNCIQMNLENPTNETLNVLLEPGRRLIASDSSLQDILIVKRKEIILKPGESQKVLAYGFCCQSSDKSPQTGSKFSIGKMAPEPWVKLAKVVDAHDFPASAVQSAVWAVSNDHPLSSIHATDLRQIDLLRRTVAGIKGVELTWYSVTYAQDNSQVFSGRHDKVSGSVEYYLKENSKVTVMIKDKSGNPLKVLSDNIRKNAGSYTFYMDVNVEDWPRGNYELVVYENGTEVNARKEFSL